jgi:predicted SnoaL-like aldol condensation-catalyzing enzyme
MSTDHVKLGHLFAEIVSSHDVSRFDEIVAPGYVNHNPFAEPGLEGVKKVFGAILAGVPDPQGVRRRCLRLGGRHARGGPLPP